VSLIEQAARRLEQLRAAGIDMPGTPGAAPAAPGGVAAAPPREPPPGDVEAIVAERRAELPLQSPPRTAEPDAEGPPRSRRVEIDLERLKAAGYITAEGAASAIATEYRVIKRPLLDNISGRSAAKVENARVIMVTSALPGEGKTFTSVNLAMSIALELDSRVLLVDADVTRPSVMAQLGLRESRGLMDVLLDPSLDLAEVLLRTNVPKLSLLPAGSADARSTELLASDAMVRFVAEAAGRYRDRILVFDAPPLLATTEARVLAKHMGQVVVVVEADRTTHAVLHDALETIRSCPVVATLLNKASRSDLGTYASAYYGYGYGYGAADRGVE
jgi:receptor protein-tyrosine kinase